MSHKGRSFWSGILVLSVSICMLYGPSAFTQTDPVGIWRFDEGSGSTTADGSGNGNTGSLTNMASDAWQQGLFWYSLNFDGSDDYVDCGADSAFNLSNFTVSCWIKPKNLSSYQGIVGKWGGGWATSPYQIIVMVDGRIKIGIGDGTYADSIYLPAACFSVGKWSHIAATYDGTTLRGYVNGVEEASKSISYTLSSNISSLKIGRYAYYEFKGMIDNVYLYDRAVNPSEILQQATAQDYMAHLKFDESSGTNASDSSAYGNSGTLYDTEASPWITGKKSGALSFSGTDDYVSIPNDPTLQITGDLTIAMWIKPATVGITRCSLLDKDYGGEYSVVLEQNGSIHLYQGRSKSSDWFGALAIPANSIVNDQWQHVVITRDIQTREIKGYLNGELMDNIEYPENSRYFPPLTTTSPVIIGDGYSCDYNGAMDDIIITNRAMSVYEIMELCQSADLCGAWEMNEGFGTTAIDSSGNGNTASFVNMDSSPWVTGHINADGYFRKALEFDGNADYLSIPNSSSLQLTGDLTISLWIKPSAVGSTRYSLVDKDYGGEFSVTLETDGSVRLYQGRSKSGGWFGASVIPAGSIVTDQWQHIAITRDITTRDIKGYLNGSLENTVVYNNSSSYFPPVATTSPVIIGDGYLTDYDGDIDNVRLYKRVLTATEISSVHFNLLSAYPDRNYYTSENPVAVCDLAMPLTELEGCTLVAKDSQGNSLGTNTTPEDGTDLSYSISSLANGSNTVTIELQRDSGELVFSQDIDILKKASSSGVEVKVDQRDSTILIDGTAFFPVGLYLYNVASGDTADFQSVADAGFNTVVRWKWLVEPSDATTFIQNADGYDLKVVDNLPSYTTESLSNYKLTTTQDFWDAYIEERDRIIDAVGYAKVEDNLIGYYTLDEPYYTQLDAGQDLYGETNSEDGYHPTFALYASNIPEGDDYTSWCDVLGVDCYWYGPRVIGNVSTSVDKVAKNVALARDRAKQDRKALWIVPMSEYYSGSHKRAILPSEQRCQTYLSLIHGAKGIFFWRYPIYHDSSWAALSDLADELSDLGPAMLTSDLEQKVNYSKWDSSAQAYVPETFSPANEQFVDIQISLRKAPAGASYDYVLLAANTREYSVDVDYTVSLLGSSGTVSRLFDTATYTVSNSKFSDNLDAFATRAYTFSSTLTTGVEIDVETTPQGSYSEETIHPVSGRANCTNLMQNPSLEDETLANWPNYLWPYHATPRINAANQGWGLVSSSPYDGSKCLKITKTSTVGSNGFLFRLAPEHDDPNGKDYTFSVYLKADSSGYSVRLGSTDGTYTTVNPTTSWARYSFTVNISDDVDPHHRFYLLLLSDGTIWADAVQVEQASSASTFTTN